MQTDLLSHEKQTVSHTQRPAALMGEHGKAGQERTSQQARENLS